ncbi:MAG: hypothetical protein ACO1OO_09585 [Flavisolibacter sp.]
MTKEEIIYENPTSLNNHFKNTIDAEDVVKYIEEKIRKSLRTKLERVSYPGKTYPKLTVLDRTRNIFGYIVISELKENSEYLQNNFYNNKLIKEIQITYSELDRPVFYVYWIFNEEGVLRLKFQTSEQIHDLMINRLEAQEKMPFNLLKSEMGEFDEMIKIINSNL